MDKQKQHILTMEYCPALQRNEILTHDTMWASLEDITLSEIRDAKGQISHASISMRYLKQLNVYRKKAE